MARRKNRKKTKTELEAEVKQLRRSRLSSDVALVITEAIRYGTFAFIAFCLYRSVEVLSGKETEANILVNFIGNLTASQSIAWIFGGGALIYGWRQKKLRQDTVERLQGRIEKYESDRDPKRTSSGLTQRGETRPED